VSLSLGRLLPLLVLACWQGFAPPAVRAESGSAEVAVSDSRRIELYEPRSRSAQDLLPLVAAILGDEGEAIVDRGTGKLLLIGAPKRVGEALAVLAKQDRPLAQYEVHYESRSETELEASGVRVVWRAGGSGPRVGVLGERVRLRSGRVRATADHRSSGAADDFAGMLRVEEGRPGHIATGSSFPVDLFRSNYWGRPQVETAYLETTRGFEVLVRRVADGVEVSLSPVDERRSEDGAIERTAATTVVTIAPGETVVVARVSEDGKHREYGVPTLYRAGRDRGDRVLLLRVERAGGPAASP
jgi:hypothetical protein